MLMQGLFPGESVHQFENYRGCTVTIEYLRSGLGDHSINDLGGDGDGCPFVVGYYTEELEVKNVERV